MNIHKLKEMIKEPASKEWFEKHGSSKGKALQEVKSKISSRLAESKHVESPREKQIRENNQKSHESGLKKVAKARHERRHGHGERTSKAEALQRAREFSKER